jgi:hypothetical protein
MLVVVVILNTYSISAYRHYSCEFESRSWRGALDKTCDKVCQWLATCLWISLGTPISATKVVTELPYDHDGSSSVKLKGNCFIDIDGIYDYHCI